MTGKRNKPAVLIVGSLDPGAVSGGSCLMVWTVQALSRTCELTLLTWDSFDPDAANANYGSALEPESFRAISMPAGIRAAFAGLRRASRVRHLRRKLFMRQVRRVVAADSYDAVLGMINEMDIGRPAIQYVHYPHEEEFVSELGHRSSLLFKLYGRLGQWVSPASRRNIAANRTLVNSDWTGSRYARIYAGEALTVYPPVLTDFPDVAFAARESCFVCIGRLEPTKEFERVIAILDAVRGRGHAVSLHIAGTVEAGAYYKRIRSLVVARRDWITIHLGLSRVELIRLVTRMRYGIHGKRNEDFGIAPAELQRAGCITFVPDSGGVTEVVNGDERVIYHSVEDAAGKIVRVLEDPELRADVYRAVLERRDRFSEGRFMRAMRDAVADELRAAGQSRGRLHPGGDPR